jgi:hypothetical protein
MHADMGLSYRRPTAAFFFSDLSSKRAVTIMEMAARRMVPRFPRCLPPEREMPFSSHPPHGPAWPFSSDRIYKGVASAHTRTSSHRGAGRASGVQFGRACSRRQEQGQRTLQTGRVESLQKSCGWPRLAGGARAMANLSFGKRRGNEHRNCQTLSTPL